MLQALTERQVRPHLLVGTSAGALNAAFVAGRGTGHAALRDVAESRASVQRHDIFQPQPLRHPARSHGRAALNLSRTRAGPTIRRTPEVQPAVARPLPSRSTLSQPIC